MTIGLKGRKVEVCTGHDMPVRSGVIVSEPVFTEDGWYVLLLEGSDLESVNVFYITVLPEDV